MTQRPFDARQALLSDHDAPAGAWRTVSLVTAMREFIARDPDGVIPNAAAHCATLTLCAEELTARGLDANSLVRYGLGHQLVASVLGPYLAGIVDPTATFDGPHTLAEARASEWQDLLNAIERKHGLDPQSIAPTPEGLGAPLGAIIPSVLLWCQNASLADLISLKAPDLDWLRAQRFLKTEDAVLQQYQWMVDRFSITNLGDWAESSLHLEYHWSNDNGTVPCVPEIMMDRAVPRADLDREIARRTMTPSGPEIPQINASLASRMQDQACTLLKERKFDAAATLFEFAVSENPRDACAQNNLGFCLMPSDPDRAWAHLGQAAQLHYEPAIINILNRVQCLALLGDKTGALELADQEWTAAALTPHMPAILWKQDPNSGALALTERVDPADALATLALDLAEEVGFARERRRLAGPPRGLTTSRPPNAAPPRWPCSHRPAACRPGRHPARPLLQPPAPKQARGTNRGHVHLPAQTASVRLAAKVQKGECKHLGRSTPQPCLGLRPSPTVSSSLDSRPELVPGRVIATRMTSDPSPLAHIAARDRRGLGLVHASLPARPPAARQPLRPAVSLKAPLP